MQYWGGPPTYNEQRGHPRLRMRHAPFVIGPPSATRGCGTWTRRCEELHAAGRIDDADADELRAYLDMAAHQLVNTG